MQIQVVAMNYTPNLNGVLGVNMEPSNINGNTIGISHASSYYQDL